MGIGARFEVLVGEPFAYFVELQTLENKQARARVLETRALAGLPKPYLHLYLSMPKPAKFEWILEKAVELGVKSLTPVFSDYSFIKKEQLFRDKARRFTKIIESACQQSARAVKLELRPCLSFDLAVQELTDSEQRCGLFAYEGEGALSLKQALQQPAIQTTQEVALLVGSEGGFSLQERQACIDNGLLPISLGPQVLRVETACVTLISVIKYELELFDRA